VYVDVIGTYLLRTEHLTNGRVFHAGLLFVSVIDDKPTNIGSDRNYLSFPLQWTANWQPHVC